jgi:hypothetical protein
VRKIVGRDLSSWTTFELLDDPLTGDGYESNSIATESFASELARGDRALLAVWMFMARDGAGAKCCFIAGNFGGNDYFQHAA